MMLTVTRRYHFEAAHFLPNVPEGHRCKRMHGHNYKVEVTLNGKVHDYLGWIADFYDMDNMIGPILKKVDHLLLNEIEGLQNPTVENIAPWFLAQLNEALDVPKHARNGIDPRFYQFIKVRVYETDDCWADCSMT